MIAELDPLSNMPEETLYAFLEDKGYRRHEMQLLDRWYIAAVLCHPRNPDTGRLDFDAYVKRKSNDPRDFYRAKGMTEHQIDEILQKKEQERNAVDHRRKNR